MKAVKVIFAVQLMIHLCTAMGWNYTYARNGSDWGDLVGPNGEVNMCGTSNLKQSPINLMTPIGSYGWAYGLPVPKAQDKQSKIYKDLKKQVKLDFQDDTMRIELAEVESAENYFNSELASSLYNSSATKYNAIEFHLHTPSEHTRDGKHYDMELHIMHKAQISERMLKDDPGMIEYAGVAIFFSVYDYDKDITQGNNETVK